MTISPALDINNSQMFHVMDEAEEHGEKIAEAAERNKPKTEEERKEEMVDEALGIWPAEKMLFLWHIT